MQCSKCGCTTLIKNGIVHARQRYCCKSCGYNFTIERKSTAFPSSIKQQALQLYLEGNGFRAIARLLGVSHVSVYRWIRNMGEQATAIQSPQKIDVVEIDELHTYIGNKKLLLGVDSGGQVRPTLH
jgi:transposase-like protein